MWKKASEIPRLKKDHGWMKESVVVLVKGKGQVESDDWFKDKKEDFEGFFLAQYMQYKKKSEWEPVIDHLWASTMPSADYNIKLKHSIEIIEWCYIDNAQ